MLDRRTLAAIHVAKKQLDLDDDDYRAMLKREAGVASARDLDEAGARRVMLWFDNHGFTRTDKAKGTAGDRRPIVQKARALWISLWQLDEVADRRDKALDAFTRRTTGKDTLRFCTNGEAGKVVEALKAWCQRVGAEGNGVRAVIAEQLRRLLACRDQGCGSVDGYISTLSNCGRETEARQRDVANLAGSALRRLKLGHRHKSPSQTEGA